MSMKPFVVDPSSYDKREAISLATTYVNDFLALNDMEKPNKLIINDRSHRRAGWRNYGWYRFNDRVLCVNLYSSRPPTKTPGFAWSFTGFKADLTAPGILAHEIGHHVHNVIEDASRCKPDEIRRMVKEVVKNERPVSSYEPNHYEVIAEAMRLFILNPELLREGRPWRWSLLTAQFGLKPPHVVAWKNVLTHAHTKIVSAAENWIKQRKT